MSDEWIRRAHVDLEDLWESSSLRLFEAYEVEAAPRWRLELDCQPYAEIWLVRAGRCAVALGGEQALAGPGEVVVLRPGRRRVSANGAAGPLSLSGFGCSLTAFGAIDLLGELDVPLVLRSPSARLVRLIERTVQAAHGDRLDRVFRARALAELALAEIVPPDLAAPPLRAELEAALRFVADHFGEPLDLAAIARSAHLSPKHLSRVFRDTLGIPPMAYVRRYRLHWAREQLVTTLAPVTTIGLEAGFTGPAHFSRAFRAEHGVSPRTLRAHARALRASARSAPSSDPLPTPVPSSS